MTHSIKRLFFIFFSVAIVLIFIVFSLKPTKTTTENSNAKVKIIYDQNRYKLLKDNKEIYLKGVAGTSNLLLAKKIGANAIRTYNTHNLKQILDSAQLLNMHVVVGLWVDPYNEHNTFINSNDNDKITRSVLRDVERFKNHPAVLFWAIGNEIYTGSIPNIFPLIFINKLAKEIHKVDNTHPVCTIVAGYPRRQIPFIRYFCPELDLLAFNSFGGLKDIVKKSKNLIWGYSGPFFISEWGFSGYWEYFEGTNSRNALLEPEANAKAKTLLEFNNHIQSMDNNLGQFAFYWGNYTEFTHTWWSLHSKYGARTPEIDIIQKIYSGKFPLNRCPKIDSIKINNSNDIRNFQLKSNNDNVLEIFASDPENDSLRLEIEIFSENKKNKDFYGKEKEPPNFNSLIKSKNENKVVFTSPPKGGNYRIFIYAIDSKRNTSNISVPIYLDF